jgi:spore coat polysaccharide biosynthesis predicted glycosyltransferase SpsG
MFWLNPEFGPLVGYGHLSRLIAITEELILRKHQYCFHFSDLDDPIANEMMKTSGLSFGCRCNNNPDFVIVDSYKVNINEPVFTPYHKTKILQIVDEINQKFYADAYIQASPITNWRPANNSAAILDFNVSPILRKRFDSNGLLGSFNSHQNNKILISLGASNAIQEIIISIKIALDQSRYRNHEIYCVLSGTDLNSLRLFLSENGIYPIEPGISLVDIAFDFDFVISACGVTGWEIVSSKIPCIFIGGAENQRSQLDYFINQKIADGSMFENQNDFIVSFGKKLNEFSTSKFMMEILNGRIRAVDWIEGLKSI